MKKNAKFKSIFHFHRLFTKLKIINVNGAGSLRLSRNYRVIDYALGIVILAGIVKIMSRGSSQEVHDIIECKLWPQM